VDHSGDIFLARHGETEWNLLRRIQGQTNTVLSSLGIRQGQDLLRALKDQPISAIYTSSLDRTMFTARPLADHLDLSLQATDLLNEMAFGEMEGKCLSELTPGDEDLWSWWGEDPIRRRIPGGENYLDLRRRAALFLEDPRITGQKGTVLVVGHLRINQMLLGLLLDLPVEKAAVIKQPNNWLYRFRKGSQIRRAVIPDREGEQLYWQTGLVLTERETWQNGGKPG
jgi:broad specificity phosphatase PhoE